MKANIDKTPLPLVTRVDRIGQHVVRARLFLDLWFYFEGPSRPKIIDTMQGYGEFFRFTPHAYLISYVIYITGVFDKPKGTISFYHLIRDSKNSGHLKKHDLVKIDPLMSRAIPLVNKVFILRHKAIAHRSAHISYDDVFELAGVNIDQLFELTDLSLQIANCLLLSCGLPDQYFNKLAKEHANSMLIDLAQLVDSGTTA